MNSQTRVIVGNTLFVVLIANLSVVGIALSFYITQQIRGLTGQLIVLGVALAMGILALAIHSILRETLLKTSFNSSTVTADYSKQIASSLDLNQLAQIAGKALSQSVEATTSALLLITEEKGETRVDVLVGLGRVPTAPLKLPLKDSFVSLFTDGVTTKDQLKSLEATERKWLSRLEMEVYAPIYDGEKLSGILAAGKRRNGSYGKTEIAFISAITDQTSVALKNARLVNNLRTLYTEMQSLNDVLAYSNERMKDMDKVKTDFITITSHELRTPLTQIIGFSDLLNMMGETETVPGAELKEITDNIIKSCSRLNEVITQMLDVSQTDLESLRLKFVETDIETILRGAVEPLASSITERKLSFTVQQIRGLPRLNGDPKRLSQTLKHIIGNAIKYTPDGGHIDVSFKYIARDPQRGEAVEIVVSDSGVGVNPKYLELIFEKFFRVGSTSVHSTGTTKFMGAGPGLGLAIAKGIVEGHGGKIWAESPGYDMEKLPGTQIHIILPLKPVPFTATTKSSSAFIGLQVDENTPDIKV